MEEVLDGQEQKEDQDRCVNVFGGMLTTFFGGEGEKSDLNNSDLNNSEGFRMCRQFSSL